MIVFLRQTYLGWENGIGMNIEGLFLFNEKWLTDVQARKIIEYGLSKGYRYDIDITDDEVQEILKNKVYERD